MTGDNIMRIEEMANLRATPEECRQGKEPKGASQDVAQRFREEVLSGAYCASKGYPPSLCACYQQLMEAHQVGGNVWFRVISPFSVNFASSMKCKPEHLWATQGPNLMFWVWAVTRAYLGKQEWWVAFFQQDAVAA